MKNNIEKILERIYQIEQNRPNKILFRYGFAFLASVSALVLKQYLFPEMDRAPFLLPFAAVALSSIIGGLGPGIFSTLFLGFAINILVTNSKVSFTSFQTYQLVFILEGIFLSIVVNAREHAKELAKRNIQELAITLSSIGDGVVRADCDGRIVFMNHIAEKLTGWKKEEAFGVRLNNVLNIINEGSNKNICSKILKNVKSLKTNREGIFLKSKKKETTPIDLAASPVKSNGKVVGIVIVLRDNTERHKAKVALEQRENHFREMADQTPALVWMVDAQSTPIYFNKEWLKFTGKTMKEIIEGDFFSDLHPSDQERVRYLYATSLAEKKDFTVEFRIKNKSGNYRWILTKGVPFHEGRSFKGYMGSAIDITDMKQNEEKNFKLLEEVQEQRKRVRNIISNVPGIVWEAEALPGSGKSRITFVSKYAETMLGYELTDWFEENFWVNLIHPEDREKTLKEFASILGKKIKGILQYRLTTKNGSIIWVETQAVTIHDKNGKAVGVRGVTTDITQQVEFEKKKDEFISIASHELKTPVTSMKLFTQLLTKKARNNKEEDFLKYLLKIDNQLNNMTDLINDLLDISRIQAGKLQFYKEDLDLNGLIQETVDSIQTNSEKHQIKLEGIIPGKVYADPHRISQVLVNLLTNAIKYSPNSENIFIKAEKKDGKAMVSVKDFGIGVSKRNQKKIFERFYRAEGNKERTFPGLGIGLYIASEIVRRHNGAIGVESTKGKGSTFFFTLPLIK